MHSGPLRTTLGAAVLILLVGFAACKTSGEREILIGEVAVDESSEEPTGPSPLDTMNELIALKRIDTRDPDWKTNVPRPPTIRFPKDRTLYWMIETSVGLLKIKLYPREAPRHVATTMYLAQLGFYDDLVFTKVVPKEVAIAGDPLGTGEGGPGFFYREGKVKRPRPHDKRGVVSGAETIANGDGSQFQILLADKNPKLDEKHIAFGEVVQGEGTLRAMETFGSRSGKTRGTLRIERSWIVETTD